MPKVSTPTEFLASGSAEDYAALLTVYKDALEVKAMLKNKKKGETLVSLDKWFQEDLGDTVRARTPPHMIVSELVRLMDWKLSRGKFRPRLIELAQSNPDDLVQDATTKGIKLAQAGKIEEAIEAVSTLKGVGPATASAVLAISVPEKCSFFADEVALAVPALQSPSKKLKYNIEEYMILNEEMTDCAKRLNKGQKKGKENKNAPWNPHKVELAVWTHSLLYHNKPKLLESTTPKRAGEEIETNEAKKQKK